MTSRRQLLIALASLAVTGTATAATTPAEKTTAPAKKTAAAPAKKAATAPKKKAPAKAPAKKAKPKAPEPRLVITINKVSQKMTVVLDGDTKFKWAVSTGAPGYDTPSGSYRPFRLEKEHYSKEWDDAPMPYSIFFTGRGHAVHGSYHVKSLGKRASHGCVRLHPDNAAKLFSLVSQTGLGNTRVVVKGGVFEGGFGDDEGKKKKRLLPWFNRT